MSMGFSMPIRLRLKIGHMSNSIVEIKINCYSKGCKNQISLNKIWIEIVQFIANSLLSLYWVVGSQY